MTFGFSKYGGSLGNGDAYNDTIEADGTTDQMTFSGWRIDEFDAPDYAVNMNNGGPNSTFSDPAGDHFQFVSFTTEVFCGTSWSFDVVGYKDGSPVSGASTTYNLGGVGGPTTRSVGFASVDEVRFENYSTDNGNQCLVIDDIVLDQEVVSNTAPSFSNLDATVAFDEAAGTPVVIDADATIEDTELDSAGDYAGSTLTVEREGGANADDDFGFDTGAGTFSVSGGNLLSGGSVFASFTNTGGTLTVSFNSSGTTATSALADDVLQALTYANSGSPDVVEYGVTLTFDDGSLQTSESRPVVYDPELAAIAVPTTWDFTELEAELGNLDSVDARIIPESAHELLFHGFQFGDASESGSIASSELQLDAVTPSAGTTGTIFESDEPFSLESIDIDNFSSSAQDVTVHAYLDGSLVDSRTFSYGATSGYQTRQFASANAAFANVDEIRVTTSVNDSVALDNIVVNVGNTAPELGGTPADATATEDVATAINLSAYNVSDADGDNVTLTLAVDRGTLASIDGDGTTAGVTVAGSGSASMTLAGPAANLNTYLDDTSRIEYTTDSNDTTTATLTVTPNDGMTDGTADTVTINVSPVNDAPSVSGAPSDVTVTEDTQSNVDLSTMSFADVDGDNLTVTLTASAGTFAAPADGAGVGAGVTETQVNATTVTLAGSAGDISTYLDTASSIQYTAAANVSGQDQATITVSASDGNGGSLAADPVINVDVTAVNDPPVIANLAGDTTALQPGGGSAIIDNGGDASVSNVDSADYNGGSLFITDNGANNTANGDFTVDGTVVTAGGDATIAAGETIAVGVVPIGLVDATNDGQGGNSLQLDLDANADNARVQTLLRNVGWRAAAGTGAQTFTATLNDADGTANGGDQDASADFTMVLDNPPTLGGAAPDVTITEDTTAAIDLSAYNVGDADGDVVTLTLAVDAGIIATTDGDGTTGGVTITGSGTAMMTLQGAVANLNTYLDDASKVVYTPIANSTTAVTLTVTPDDGLLAGTADTITISINAIPVVTAPTIPDIPEDAPAQALADDVQITDANGDDQSVSVSATNGAIALGVSAGLSFTDSDGSDGSLAFSGGLAAVNTALDSLSYTPTSNVTGAASLTVSTVDPLGVGDSAVASFTILDQEPAIADASFGVVSNTPAPGTAVGTLETTGDLTGLSYTITAGNTGGLFAIDANGELTVASAVTSSDLPVTLTVAVDDEDADSLANDTATVSITDNAPPALLSFTRQTPSDEITNADSLVVRANFDEDVQNLDAADFSVVGTTASVANIDIVTADSAFDLTISGGDLADLDGIVGLDLSMAQDIADAAGNALPSGEPATDETYTLDNTGPELAGIERQAPTEEVTNADTLTFRATFDSDVQNVDPSDFTVTGTTAALSVSTVTADTVFDLTVSGGDLADLDGTVGIDLAPSQDIIDGAGNALPGNEPATDETYAVDNTAPTVTVDSLTTTDATPPLTGTVDDNDATLELTVDGQTVTPTNNGDGTWTLADDTLSALADGTYDVAVTATDPVGNEDSDTTSDELTVTPDTDGDGIDDAIENAGPNGGDANNDGTPDADQSSVTSLPTATGRGYMTVQVTGPCAQLQEVAAVDPASLPADPADNPYPFGLVEFTLPCESAAVDVVYHAAVAGDFVTSNYRKYGPITPGNPATAGWYDFSDYASLTDTTWTLDLADNRLGDDTGDDGLIVDQGGPARGPALPIPANQPWALWLLIAVSFLLAHRSLSRVGRRTF